MGVVEWTGVFGNVGEAVGAFAVVVTLAYLALQIRQSNVHAQSQTYKHWSEVIRDTFLGVINEQGVAAVLLKALDDPRDLEGDEWLRAHQFFVQLFTGGESVFLMYKEGLMPEEIWQKQLERIGAVLQFPGALQWWQAGGRDFVTRDFAVAIEALGAGPVAMEWDKERGFVRREALP